MTAQPDEPHQCTLREDRDWHGRMMLSPCSGCGRPASEILEKLRGDKLRRIVRKFLAEAPRFMTSAIQTSNAEESNRWHGQSLARQELFDRLQQEDVDVVAFPLFTGESTPAPRNALGVRNLHVLVSLDDQLGVGACKADGYISQDLTADPCPTLRELNRTDPLPVPPLVDANRLAAQIFDALNAALDGGMGDTGWSMADEARRIADSVAANLPTTDLEHPAIKRAIGHAIAAPSTYAIRQGSVPEHQVDAVIAALRKALE